MHSEGVILETDKNGHLLGVPALPTRRQIEAIFLLLPTERDDAQHRTPQAELAGTAIIHGDIVSPILPGNDWNALA